MKPRARQRPGGDPGEVQSSIPATQYPPGYQKAEAVSASDLPAERLLEVGPPRCQCCWPARSCPHVRRYWHAMSIRPDVRAGAPSSWHAMIAAGFSPTTGEPLPEFSDVG